MNWKKFFLRSNISSLFKIILIVFLQNHTPDDHLTRDDTEITTPQQNGQGHACCLEDEVGRTFGKTADTLRFLPVTYLNDPRLPEK